MIYNLVLLGPPGSGKSTQAHLLVNRLNAEHIDMGASLRKVAGENSAFGRFVYNIINVRKELVSDTIVGNVLDHELKSLSLEKSVIVDGAPRRLSQIDEVENAFARNNRSIDAVIALHLPEEISTARIASRFACAVCGKAVMITRPTDNLRCVDCHGVLRQRVDDTPEGVRKRLAVFAEETAPVIEQYRSKRLLIEVDGTKGAGDIHQDIINKLSLCD